MKNWILAFLCVSAVGFADTLKDERDSEATLVHSMFTIDTNPLRTTVEKFMKSVHKPRPAKFRTSCENLGGTYEGTCKDENGNVEKAFFYVYQKSCDEVSAGLFTSLRSQFQLGATKKNETLSISMTLDWNSDQTQLISSGGGNMRLSDESTAVSVAGYTKFWKEDATTFKSFTKSFVAGIVSGNITEGTVTSDCQYSKK